MDEVDEFGRSMRLAAGHPYESDYKGLSEETIERIKKRVKADGWE